MTSVTGEESQADRDLISACACVPSLLCVKHLALPIVYTVYSLRVESNCLSGYTVCLVLWKPAYISCASSLQQCICVFSVCACL